MVKFDRLRDLQVRCALLYTECPFRERPCQRAIHLAARGDLTLSDWFFPRKTQDSGVPNASIFYLESRAIAVDKVMHT